jgi:hypothetical protein
MGTPTYNNQTMTEYLLGSLPEAETERFDELSFTNREFGETLSAAEKDLVDAYVLGELTGAELERFKFHYLASPLRRERVQFAQAFQVLAERNPPLSEEAAKPSKKRKAPGWFSSLQWAFPVMALVFLLVGGWFALENARLRHQMSESQARRDALVQREQELQKELDDRRSTNAKTEQELARVTEERRLLEDELKKDQQQPSRPGEGSVFSFILTPQMRGIGQSPTISIPADTQYVAVQLALESDDYPAYRVALLDPSTNQVLWRSGRTKATGNTRALSVRFRAGVLKPQTYLLRVSGVPPTGVPEIVGDYPFRVAK